MLQCWTTFLLVYIFIESLFIAVQGRVNSPPSTYDTFVPNRTSGQQQLIELQQRVKAGSLSVDGAVKHFGEWQRTQKAMDAGQKVWD